MYATALPSVQKRDVVGRLHSEVGPALIYQDGLREWYWRGLKVDQRLIENPGTITISEINGEQNLELRRCMLERYGMDKYLTDSGAEKIGADSFGALYRTNGMAFVVVENGTPDAAGVRRRYVLGVDASATSAHEAVASTYGMTAREYHPQLRT